jgi:rhomboid-like protein
MQQYPQQRYQNAPKVEIVGGPGFQRYQDAEREEPPFFRVKVRLLRPAIFAFSLSTAIYVALAYWEARNEVKPKRVQDYMPQWRGQQRTPPTPTEVVTRAWVGLDPMSKISWGLIGSNSAIHLTKLVAPAYWSQLWHTPALNVNYSLLTSAFVHSGPLHLGFNMYALYNFLPPVGYTKLFHADTNHMLSFYLATGLLSGYAQHVASIVFTRYRSFPPAIVPSGGASGALFGILGAFCMEYPNHGIGLMFVPGYLDAQYVLPAIMLFDFIGMVRPYPFVSLGHAVSQEILVGSGS